jgi:hypothetical protein
LTVLPEFEGALVCLRDTPDRSRGTASAAASGTRLTYGHVRRLKVLRINTLGSRASPWNRPFRGFQGTSGWTWARNAGRTDNRW